MTYKLTNFIQIPTIGFLSVFTCLFLHALSLQLISQEAKIDSLSFTKHLQDLQNHQQFATVQDLLQEKIQKEGFKPFFTCWMIQNGLRNYYQQDNFNTFYLKNNSAQLKMTSPININSNLITRLRFPQRILQKLIHLYPDNPCPYKLLGDYYELQLVMLKNFNSTLKNKVRDLEEKIFSFYSMADKLGYENIDLNCWLGNYYLKHNQPEKAESYFLKNINNHLEDPLSLYRLAEISYSNKQFTQSLNYANRAYHKFTQDDFFLKYDALRLTANSLKALGELDKFLNSINECIQMLPDAQDAYIDLINYYISDNNTEEIEKLIKQMLLNNPFDLKGYRKTEHYITHNGNFYFGDSLFDEMLMQFENWDEIMANIYWSKGNLAFNQGLESEARKFWEISRNYMRRYLPEDSPTLKQVGKVESK